MANKKITQLTPLPSQSLASNDLFVVVDIDAGTTPTGETKTITSDEFYGYLRDNGLADSSSYSSTSTSASFSENSISSSYAITASYALNIAADIVTGSFLEGLHIIEVDTLGDDNSGNLTSPFATLKGAFQWLQSRRIASGSVEIHIQTGSYTETTPDILYHVDAQKITIKGNGGDDLITYTGAKYNSVTSNGDANHTASIDVNATTANAAEIGDWILISDVDANTIGDVGASANTRGLCGMWEIISKSGNTLGLFATYQTNDITGRFSTSPSLTTHLIKTKLIFNGCSGIVIDSCDLRSIQNLGIIGSGQSQGVGAGGDGLSVGQFKNSLDESTTNVDSFYVTRKGFASVVASRVGCSRFAHAGFSARNGSLTALYCGASSNYYGFVADGANKIDAPHCSATGNSHSGFSANNRSTINAKYASSCYNLFYGLIADDGSTIICDNLDNTDKCTFVGPNGFTECLARNGSQLTMNGSYVRSYGSLSSSMQPDDDYFVIGSINGSNVTAQFCLVQNLQNGLEVINNSVVVFDSSLMSMNTKAAKIVNNSAVSFGNAQVSKLSTDITTLIDVINNSSVNVPAFRVTATGNNQSSSFYLTDNSSLNLDGDYEYDASRVPSGIVEYSPSSLQIDQDQGNRIWCNNKSSAIIYSLTGSNGSVSLDEQYVDLRATYGSLIRAKNETSSSLSHYPNSNIPFSSDLSTVRFS